MRRSRSIEDALSLRPALSVLLSDPMLLPKSLREGLPLPIRLPWVSPEAIVAALTKTLSRASRMIAISCWRPYRAANPLREIGPRNPAPLPRKR